MAEPPSDLDVCVGDVAPLSPSAPLLQSGQCSHVTIILLSMYSCKWHRRTGARQGLKGSPEGQPLSFFFARRKERRWRETPSTRR